MKSLFLSFLVFLSGLGAPNAVAEDFNFETSGVITRWIGSFPKGPAYGSYNTYLNRGVPLALDYWNEKAKEWELFKIVYYKNGRAFPIPYENIQISQNPFQMKRIPMGGIAFLRKKSDSNVRVAFSFSWNYTSIYYDRKKPERLESIRNELKYLIEDLSPYRGGVLEFNEAGFLGFLKNVEKYQYSWDSLILPKGEKEAVRKTVEEFVDNYDYKKWKSYGIPLNRGVLLHGPPGTGKSLIGKILISKMLLNKYKNDVTYLHVVARHIVDTRTIRNIYNAARIFNPSAVFIEDIDLIAGTDREHLAKVKNELMQQLSGVEELNGVISLGTTNYFDLIDSALKRSKRLGYHYKLGVPKHKEREALFELFAKGTTHKGLEFSEFAMASDHMTGADISQVMRLARERAIEIGSIDTSKNQVILTNDIVFEAINRSRAHKLIINPWET